MNEDDNVALFDMDESLAGFVPAMVRDLELLRSPGEDEITEDNIWTMDRHRYISNRMKLIKNQPGWWLNLEPIQPGLAVLQACKAVGMDIAILTKGPQAHANAWTEKLLWCQRHIDPLADVTVTFKKSRVYGKILYDDYPEYMLLWLKRRPRGLGIMPVTAANEKFSHPNVIRYRGLQDLDQVKLAIAIAKKRQPGEELKL